jgi:phospholipase/carboxylesterase
MIKMLSAITILIVISINGFCQQDGLQTDLALKYLFQPPTEKTTRPPVIIFLHGYGSDERDLFELRNSIPKSFLVLSVRAPYPLAHGGYEWYESVKGHDGKKEQLKNSRTLINKFITQAVAKYNADAKEVYLAGFSQGAIMCYETGLTTPETIKGIAVLSGMIFPSLKPLVNNNAELKKLKIFAGHGTTDDRIPFADGKSACNYLQSIGLLPEFHAYTSMAHAISNEEMKDVVKWMKK